MSTKLINFNLSRRFTLTVSTNDGHGRRVYDWPISSTRFRAGINVTDKEWTVVMVPPPATDFTLCTIQTSVNGVVTTIPFIVPAGSTKTRLQTDMLPRMTGQPTSAPYGLLKNFAFTNLTLTITSTDSQRRALASSEAVNAVFPNGLLVYDGDIITALSDTGTDLDDYAKICQLWEVSGDVLAYAYSVFLPPHDYGIEFPISVRGNVHNSRAFAALLPPQNFVSSRGTVLTTETGQMLTTGGVEPLQFVLPLDPVMPSSPVTPDITNPSTVDPTINTGPVIGGIGAAPWTPNIPVMPDWKEWINPSGKPLVDWSKVFDAVKSIGWGAFVLEITVVAVTFDLAIIDTADGAIPADLTDIPFSRKEEDPQLEPEQETGPVIPIPPIDVDEESDPEFTIRDLSAIRQRRNFLRLRNDLTPNKDFTYRQVIVPEDGGNLHDVNYQIIRTNSDYLWIEPSGHRLNTGYLDSFFPASPTYAKIALAEENFLIMREVDFDWANAAECIPPQVGLETPPGNKVPGDEHDPAGMDLPLTPWQALKYAHLKVIGGHAQWQGQPEIEAYMLSLLDSPEQPVTDGTNENQTPWGASFEWHIKQHSEGTPFHVIGVLDEQRSSRTFLIEANPVPTKPYALRVSMHVKVWKRVVVERNGNQNETSSFYSDAIYEDPIDATRDIVASFTVPFPAGQAGVLLECGDPDIDVDKFIRDHPNGIFKGGKSTFNFRHMTPFPRPRSPSGGHGLMGLPNVSIKRLF